MKEFINQVKENVELLKEEFPNASDAELRYLATEAINHKTQIDISYSIKEIEPLLTDMQYNLDLVESSIQEIENTLHQFELRLD